MVEEQKNNIQTNALHVGTGKHSEYYPNQNDSTVIVQRNDTNFNTYLQKINDLFEGTQYKIIDGCLYVSSERKGNKTTRKLANFVPFLTEEINLSNGIEEKNIYN